MSIIKESINNLFNISQNYQNIISIDCETTGLNPKIDSIVSIGAYKINQEQIHYGDSFFTYVKADLSQSSESIKIHGIMQADLEQALNPKQAIEEFIKWAGGLPLLGFNVNFDFQILSRYAKEYGLGNFSSKKVELVDVYLNHFPDSHKYSQSLDINTIAKSLDIPLEYKHTADGDALNVAMLYIYLKKKYP